METTTRQTRRFTADELRRMVEAGIIGPDEPLELLDGELVPVMTPRSPERGPGCRPTGSSTCPPG